MRKSVFAPFTIMAALLGILLLSCGGENAGEKDGASNGETVLKTPKAKTPEEAYGQIVSAVKMKDYGVMYDMMDSANRHSTQMWFDLNLQQANQIKDSTERAGWLQFKNIKDPRQRFIRLVEVTPQMREGFNAGYKVLSVDTVVAVVTQTAGNPPQLSYFRWEDGGYKYTAPPQSKIAPAAVRLPAQKPPDGASTPDGANKR